MDVISAFKARQEKQFEAIGEYDNPGQHTEAFEKLKTILAPVYQSVEQLHNSGIAQVVPWRAPGQSGCFTAFQAKADPKMVYKFWIKEKIDVKTTAYMDGRIKITARCGKKKFKDVFQVTDKAEHKELVELILDMIVRGKLPKAIYEERSQLQRRHGNGRHSPSMAD